MTHIQDNSLVSRDFKGIWIPREIWLDSSLSLMAKCLWAEIDSLYNEDKGGCFASDEYLCEFMGIKRSRLYEVMKELTDLGLLIKVNYDGRQIIRKAVLPKEERTAGVRKSGHIKSGKPDSPRPEKRIPTTIYNKEDNKEYNTPHIPKEKKQAKPACVFEFFSSIIKLQRKDYEKLCQDHGKPVIDDIIVQMTDWVKAKGKDPYKDHAAAIRQWVRKRTETPRQSNNSYQPDRRVKNKDGSPVINPYEGLF